MAGLWHFIKANWRNILEISLSVVIAIIIYCVFHHPAQVKLPSSERLVPVPRPKAALLEEFNNQVRAQEVAIQRSDGNVIKGYPTGNRIFLEKIIRPLIIPYVEQLRRLPPEQMINQLTLFGYEVFQAYFGASFYRWGGDIFDLDDPQESGPRHEYKYGLDCSGFAVLPYELAVYFGLLKPTAPGAEFSSKGFLLYCQRTGTVDKGGRLGSNRYRLDTVDLAQLGREVLYLPQGSKPTRRQLRLLQPGDLIGRSGHFGIIVEIYQALYYLESGGDVVKNYHHRPVRADIALQMMAARGPVTVRRALPDRNK